MWSWIKSAAGTAFSLFTGGSSWPLLLVGLLAVALAFGGGVWLGWSKGHSSAEAAGKARYSALESVYAQAQANATETARQMYADGVERGHQAERDLAKARRAIAARTEKITDRRISDVAKPAAGGQCVFGPDVVRFVREAVGFGGGDQPLPPSASRAGGAAGATPAVGPGVLSGAGDGSATVSLEDWLAYWRYYGARCQGIEAQLGALIDWAEGR